MEKLMGINVPNPANYNPIKDDKGKITGYMYNQLTHAGSQIIITSGKKTVTKADGSKIISYITVDSQGNFKRYFAKILADKDKTLLVFKRYTEARIAEAKALRATKIKKLSDQFNISLTEAKKIVNRVVVNGEWVKL